MKKQDEETRKFTEALIRYTEHRIAAGEFGAGLEMNLQDQVQDVVFWLLYEEADSARRVKKRLK
jgi:hypothetical protein